MNLLFTTLIPLIASALPERQIVTNCRSDLVQSEDVFAKYPELDRSLLAAFTWSQNSDPATVGLQALTGTLKELKTGNLRLSLIRQPGPHLIGVALKINFPDPAEQAAFVERIVRLKQPGSISEIYQTTNNRLKGDVVISVGTNDIERSRQLLVFAAYLVNRLRAGYSSAELIGR